MKKYNVLICANPDLNYIDGSSIWSQTIALAVAETGIANVDFLARSKPQREELFKPLRNHPDIQLFDASDPTYWNGKQYKSIPLKSFAKVAAKIDHVKQYDVIIVRGLEIAQTLLNYPKIISKCWLYLTDIPHKASEFTDELKLSVKKLAEQSAKIICQTVGLKNLWQSIVPELSDEKIKIYTPVIPDFDECHVIPITERAKVAIYAGKYRRSWNTLEMLQQWPLVKDKLEGARIYMVGDKIDADPNDSTYQDKMRRLLESTKGIEWLGAKSREEVQVLLKEARVGLSWRAADLDESLEYSTKILEYGGAGCAAILNSNTIHHELLGKDYPLYANSEDEFVEKLNLALSDDSVCQMSANILQKVAAQHTFSGRVKEISNWLSEGEPINRSETILVAGHDLKFFTLLHKKLEATGQYKIIIDKWQGHDKHDENLSKKLLSQANIIFCEWCLGNINWYSHHKMPHQRLVGRFHLQERELPHLSNSKCNQIDYVGYVSDYIYREGQKLNCLDNGQVSVIPNLLDSERFSIRKKAADAQYTLGIIGVVPARKRLDQALDLLEMLLQKDSRYCLRVKGKNPLEYGWLLKRPEELKYYSKIFERINSSPLLRYKVIFDPPGDDVNAWLSLVGFILSPSDFESFHMAIGEGMLTNSIPVVWKWDGADEIWPKDYVVESTEKAHDLIAGINEGYFEEARQGCRNWVLQRYDTDEIVKQWVAEMSPITQEAGSNV